MEEVEIQTDEGHDMDMAVELEHEDSQHNKSTTKIVMNEYVLMLWTEERRQFDVKMQKLYEKLDPKSRRRRKMRTGTNGEFMDHLLDVHRSWCKACRPGIDKDKRFLHMKKGDCVDQATQTMPTMPGIFSCEASQPTKLMPRLAKIQPSGSEQMSPKERIDAALGLRRKMHDPSVKGPNIKVIKITKSKSGLLRQETCMSQESLKTLMKTGKAVDAQTFQAAQPLQDFVAGSSRLPASYVVQGKKLLSASRGKPVQLLRVVPTKKSLSNVMSSSGVVTLPVKVPSSAMSSSTSWSSFSGESITDAGIKASSSLGEVPWVADTMSFSDIYGKNVPGTSSLEPAESMEDGEGQGAPGVVFGQTKCVDEDDNDEDDIYDDGNVNLDDEEEPVGPDKKQPEVTDRPIPGMLVTVKEEPLSDTETSNLVHFDKEELSDQMQDQETGSDSKTHDSEPGMEEGVEEKEDVEEEEEEDEEEEDDDEDDEEVDYEALERKDPSYEPSSRKRENLQKKGKDKKSLYDQPGTSEDMSGGGHDSLESDGSEWNKNEEDTDKEFDKELEDNPALRANKRSVPCVCPLCLATCKSQYSLTTHMQMHLPLDQGWKSIKEAIESIEKIFGNKYTKPMGWCEECEKFYPQFKSHLNDAHNEKPRHKSSLCPQCGKIINHGQLKVHQLTHLEVDESDYVQCPNCPSRFKHKIYLSSHIRNVHVNKSFECLTCGNVFKDQHALKRHEAIHSDVKPFPCSVCDLSFTQASNLKIHMRQHTGHKPYVCEFCKKAFTNKVSLKNHKKKLHGIDWWKERGSLNKEEPKQTTSTETE